MASTALHAIPHTVPAAPLGRQQPGWSLAWPKKVYRSAVFYTGERRRFMAAPSVRNAGAVSPCLWHGDCSVLPRPAGLREDAAMHKTIWIRQQHSLSS